MAASNSTSSTSLTITQAFVGAPLRFQPAVGTQAFEKFIHAFVPGLALKSDKVSQVTRDFFEKATVDLNTGALVRSYNVALSSPYEQSPTLSQSPGLSPPLFTPSPCSSASAALGDSGYSTMTPPMRNRGSRASKKARKDTKKASEVRIPGMTIMTKDGIDITNSAGRGVKSKEQREHAHLMRIMKACDACKRKKVRCDPAHRRSHTDMSRTSSTSKSPSRVNTSSSTSVPSLSSQTTQASQMNTPLYGNPMDDFVLFPEDNSAWDPASDMSFEFNNCDLSQFNFDINDMGINEFSTVADQSFDFSAYEQSPALFQPGYTPVVTDQFGLDQWASSQGGSQDRPHHSINSQDSGQLDSSWYSSSLDTIDNSPVSRRTTAADLTDGNSSSSSIPSPSLPGGPTTNVHGPAFFGLDWNLYDSTSSDSTSQQLPGPFEKMNRKERRSRKRGHNDVIQQVLDSVPSAGTFRFQSFVNSADLEISSALRPGHSNSPLDNGSVRRPRPGFNEVPTDISGIEGTYEFVTASLEACTPASHRYQTLSTDLQQLRDVMDNFKSKQAKTGILAIPRPLVTTMQTFAAQLQGLFAVCEESIPSSGRPLHQKYNKLDPEARPEHIRQVTLNAQRLVRTFYTTINDLQVEAASSATLSCDPLMLTSGANVQLRPSPFETQNSARLTFDESSCSIDSPGYDGGESGYTTQVSSPNNFFNSVDWPEDQVSRIILTNDKFNESGSQGSSTPTDRETQQIQEARTFAPELITKAIDSDLERPPVPPTPSLFSWAPSPARSASSDDTISEIFEMSPSFFEAASGRPAEGHFHDRFQGVRDPQPGGTTIAGHTSNSSASVPRVFSFRPPTITPAQTVFAQTNPDTSPLQLGEESCWGEYPQADRQQHDSRSVSVNHSDQYILQLSCDAPSMASMLAAFVAIAAALMFALNMSLASGIMMTMLPFLLINVGALPLPLPTTGSSSSVLLIAGLAALCVAGPSIKHAQEICLQWISNDPSLAVAKLLPLCAVVAQPPSRRWRYVDGLGSFVASSYAGLPVG